MSKRRFTQNYASSSTTEEEDSRLNVFYCLCCGSFCIILDAPLSSFPKRKTDGSYVVEEDKVLRKNMVEGDVKLVKRTNGLERQYRLICPECNIFVGYRPNDHSEEGKFMYIIPEALGTRQELQGAIKHHSVAELKGQVASLLTRYSNGILLSSLRDIFWENFSQDIDEREYGDYKSLEELLGTLSDVVRLDKIPRVTDLMIVPITQTADKSLDVQTDSESTQNLKEVIEDVQDLIEANNPKPHGKSRPTALLFEETEKPTISSKVPTVKAILKVKPKTNTAERDAKQINSLVADYDE